MSNYKILLLLLTNVNNILKKKSTFFFMKAYFGNEGYRCLKKQNPLSGKNSVNKDERKPILVKGVELVTLGWGMKLY